MLVTQSVPKLKEAEQLLETLARDESAARPTEGVIVGGFYY